MILLADLTVTATLILAGVTLALVVATIGLMAVTRAGTGQARADARAELELLRRQFGAGHRPLLVDVLMTAPVAPGMGARVDVEREEGGPNRIVRYPGPTIETRLPGITPKLIDPRSAFVAIERGKVFVSVPLRNVGRGLAVVDGGGVEIDGPAAAALSTGRSSVTTCRSTRRQGSICEARREVARGHQPAPAPSCTSPPAGRAGVRRRFAPHQLRHAHAVEMSREGVPLLVIQRQLGHADLAITSVYLRGIDNTEIVHAVHERPAPMILATHGL